MVIAQNGKERETTEANAVFHDFDHEEETSPQDFASLSVAILAEESSDVDSLRAAHEEELRSLREAHRLEIEALRTAQDAQLQFEKEMMLARANDVLRQIIHDARTPLTSLKTRGYLIRKKVEKQPSFPDRETILEDTEVISKVVTLLDETIGRLRTEDLFIARYEKVRVKEVIDGVILSMDKGNDPNVNFRLKLSTPQEEIFTDKRMLISIISNMLSNAFAYTHRGEVELGIVTDQEKMIIKVRDTGNGIPEEKIPHIFEKGVSLEDSDRRSDAPKSTGFGMFILQQYVAELGGEIAVQSQLGVGTEFTVTLPMNTSDSSFN